MVPSGRLLTGIRTSVVGRSTVVFTTISDGNRIAGLELTESQSATTNGLAISTTVAPINPTLADKTYRRSKLSIRKIER
jgi:hypothetical protein